VISALIKQVLRFARSHASFPDKIKSLASTTTHPVIIPHRGCVDGEQMRKKRTTLNPLHAEKSTTLVTGGCYAWSRNPIYLGMSGLQLAFALYVGSLIGILAAPLFILVVARLHIDFEEEQLRKHFGPEWIRYEQRVRRWL